MFMVSVEIKLILRYMSTVLVPRVSLHGDRSAPSTIWRHPSLNREASVETNTGDQTGIFTIKIEYSMLSRNGSLVRRFKITVLSVSSVPKGGMGRSVPPTYLKYGPRDFEKYEVLWLEHCSLW